MTTVDLNATLAAADLNDAATRGALADALDEANRHHEAELLRGPGAVRLHNGTVRAADRVASACDIATGRAEADPDEAPAASVRGGFKDLSAKGRGPWWYRMVYRGGGWRYVSDERLPTGTFRAAERRATVRGDVYAGELVAQHDHKGPVDALYLVCEKDDEGNSLVACKFTKRRDGRLSVELPDSSKVELPDPRR